MSGAVLLSLRSALLLSPLLLAACAGTTEPVRPATLDKGTVLRIADRLRDQGDSAMAEEFYRRAISDNPDNAAAYHGLATLQVAQGDLAGAARSYRAALPHDAQNGALHRDYAKLLLAQGEYAEAVAHYRAALAVDEKDAKALNGLGVALDQSGDHHAAQQSYQQALALNADDMVAINNLSMSYIIAGDYVAAITLLEPLADSFKATEAIRQNLALAYQQVGRGKLAEASARPPLAALPEPVVALPPLPLLPINTERAAVVAPASTTLPPPPAPARVGIPAMPTVPPNPPEPPKPLLAVAAPMAVATAPAILEPTGPIPEQTQPPMPTLALPKPETVTPIVQDNPPVASSAIPAEQRTVFGPFATDQIAQAQQARLRHELADDLPHKALVNIVTRLNANGTPEFVLHLYGFANQEEIDAFCHKALKAGFPCRQG